MRQQRVNVSRRQTVVKLELRESSEEGNSGADSDSDDGLYGDKTSWADRSAKARGPTQLWAYLMSDCYIGLDIQVPVPQ